MFIHFFSFKYRSHIKELSRLPLDEPPSTRLPRATILRSKKYPQNKSQSHNLSVSSSDSSRNSSPGMNQTQSRLYATSNNHNTTGSPSLRRSLLLAARTPQQQQQQVVVPPSPSTMRRSSTLTQPTQSSAAKSAPSRNLKSATTIGGERKIATATTTRPQMMNVRTRAVSASRPANNAKRNVTTKNTQIKNTQSVVNKKAATPPPSVRKTLTSTKTQQQKKMVANTKSVVEKRTATPPPKTPETPVAVRKTMQRSDTFLKEEPTVLQKIVTT